jgi:hypothetical protein
MKLRIDTSASIRRLVVGKNRQAKNSKPAGEESFHRSSNGNGQTRGRSTDAGKSTLSRVKMAPASSHRADDNHPALSERKRLYLRVGDEVNHLRYDEWGIGVVMEAMTSSVPGGTCLVRIRFQDGQLRCFNNDLDNESCCYYFGVRRYWNPSHGVNAIRSKFFIRG